MYSSFKKQQLLTESWRKFLLEASKEELKYFGDWVDEKYLNDFSKKIMKAYEDEQFEDFSELSDDKLKFLGRGSFRAVFAPRNDKDFVIKFALFKGALEMNKSEATMVKGKNYEIPIETAKSNFDFLPKVFKTANNFSWIVIEKLNVIGIPMVFNQFFKPIADLFREFGFDEQVIQEKISKFAFKEIKKDIIVPAIDNVAFTKDTVTDNYHKNINIFKEQILKPALIKAKDFFAQDQDIVEAIEDYLENGRKEEIEYLLNKKGEKSDKIIFMINDIFYEYAGQFPLVVKIRDLVKTYGIDPNEIRHRNTGYNNKGEFKIIDSSIEDEINKAQQSTNSSPAGSTF